jgi:glycosyltransferase involved in cell wall biosynthesis
MRDLTLWGIHDKADPDKDIPSGCGYYRMVLPLTELGRHGWKVRLAPGTPDDDEIKNYSLIVGQRFDKFDVMPAWRQLARDHRLVYELDDDIWHVLLTNWSAHQTYSRPDTQDVVEHCIQVADMVQVSTAPLAELVWPHNKNVVILPNRVPAWVLDVQRPRRRECTIGWFGAASHAEDLQMVAGPVRKVLHDNPAARLHIMGTWFLPTFGVIGTRYTDWLPDPDYYRAIDFDIGLCPLTGHRFNASKSGLKAMQYMALGIPVIATDAEPYRGVVTDGVNWFLVRSRPQWRARLGELVRDGSLREQMGAAARQAARAWTYEGSWQQWDEAYRTVLT